MATTYTSKDLIILPVPPLDLGNMPFAGEGDSEETLRRARKDRETAAATQYVNFPNSNIPDDARDLLIKYEKSVLSYRSWASLRWWNTTFASNTVPQDASEESAAKRVGYCARVAEYDMKSTPWLAMSRSEVMKKEFKVETRYFHSTLVEAILHGFVSLPDGAYTSLEGLFKVITLAIETRSRVKDNIQQHIIAERYEYSPITRTIRSYIRTSLFEVTQAMVEVHRKKSSATYLDVAISYNEYEAQFNMDDWAHASGLIEEYKKKQMEDFVNEDTITVPF
jgi:hypothetical protein